MSLKNAMKLFTRKIFTEAWMTNSAILADATMLEKYEHGAATLRLAAMRLHKSYENACNRDLTTREQQAQDADEARVRYLVSQLGLNNVEFNHDPRGAPVKIVVKQVHGDDFGEPIRLLCVPYLAASYYREDK